MQLLLNGKNDKHFEALKIDRNQPKEANHFGKPFFIKEINNTLKATGMNIIRTK